VIGLVLAVEKWFGLHPLYVIVLVLLALCLLVWLLRSLR
jgi:lipopolysaccharide export LptBFGC system permease protein LptF